MTSSNIGQVDEGADVTLTCTSEVENAQLSWYAKTKGLVQSGAVYRIEKITSIQSDEYFCKSKVDSNELSSSTIKLQVKCKSFSIVVTFGNQFYSDAFQSSNEDSRPKWLFYYHRYCL